MIHDPEENEGAGVSGLEQRGRVYFHFMSRDQETKNCVPSVPPKTAWQISTHIHKHKTVMMASTLNQHKKIWT